MTLNNLRPVPVVNSDTKIFWEGCQGELLKFQVCTDCGLVRWPPSFLCPRCLSSNFELITSSGKGKIYSFIVYHKAYHSSFLEDIPYSTAVIELDEGVKFLSRILSKDISKICCGMHVEVVWDHSNAEYPIPLFKLVEEL